MVCQLSLKVADNRLFTSRCSGHFSLSQVLHSCTKFPDLKVTNKQLSVITSNTFEFVAQPMTLEHPTSTGTTRPFLGGTPGDVTRAS